MCIVCFSHFDGYIFQKYCRSALSVTSVVGMNFDPVAAINDDRRNVYLLLMYMVPSVI